MPNVTGGNRTSFGGSAQAGGNSSGGRGTAGGSGARVGGNVGAAFGAALGAMAAPSGPVAPGGNQYAGYKGPVGTRAPTSAAPGSYGLSGPETRAYDAAKMEHYKRGFGAKIVDFLSPIKSVDPQINQPSSYAGGTYHYGFNPAGLAVGALAPYGSGAVLGPAAAAAWNKAGMHDVVLTGPGSGFSTSYPGGGPGYNSSTGFGGAPGSPGTPQGKEGQSGTPLTAFPGAPGSQAPGGAPFGAQPAPAPVLGASGGNANGYFRPQIPNHTLPQGYSSLFPNSLSEQDKALLYAKALGGAA